jgi:hypothetical protein
MIIILWQAAIRKPSPGAGSGMGYTAVAPRIIDDPRFDLHAIEEEVIVTTIAAFLTKKHHE